jgi:hypothetical protein
MNTEFCWGNVTVNIYLKTERGKIILKWILGRLAVRMGGGWNCLRTVFNSKLILVVLMASCSAATVSVY